MLPLVGDRIRMINSRLLSSAALIPQLSNGPEGTVVDMLVDKNDGSGIFTVNLIRRVKFKEADTPEPACGSVVIRAFSVGFSNGTRRCRLAVCGVWVCPRAFSDSYFYMWPFLTCLFMNPRNLG